MKKILIGILLLIIIGVVAVVVLPQTLLKPKPVHFHAGFQVYKDGKLQSFTGNKYMHEAPCAVDGKPVASNGDEQSEKAHLHDHVGDVVHSHRNNPTWGDLFTNIKYPIDEKNVVAYINGNKVDDILVEKIKPYDSVIIFIGKHTDDEKYLKSAVTKKRIQEIEKRSETCSS